MIKWEKEFIFTLSCKSGYYYIPVLLLAAQSQDQSSWSLLLFILPVCEMSTPPDDVPL